MIDRSRITLAIVYALLGCAGSAVADAQQGSTNPQTPVGEAPKPQTPAAPAQVFAEPTALTPRGTFVIEPDVQYVHSTNNQVALVGYTVLPALTIGLINIQRIESNLSTFSLTARYGILSRLEMELRAPYVVENTSTETRPLATASVTNSFFNAHGNGLGDAQLS
ncbi:MAG: acetate kinase, partial [Nitrososphaerales archaeon]